MRSRGRESFWRNIDQKGFEPPVPLLGRVAERPHRHRAARLQAWYEADQAEADEQDACDRAANGCPRLLAALLIVDPGAAQPFDDEIDLGRVLDVEEPLPREAA